MRTAKFLMTTTAMAMVLASASAQADVTISGKPTQNMTCNAGVCSPTAADAVLNVTDLANMLGAGDTKVTTGGGATNIVVKTALGWTSTSRLTLDAIQSVEIDKPVMVTGTGAVTITTNDGGTGGDLMFDGKGNVTFWDLNSSLIVNGNSYTLVGNIATLASDIASNPSGFYALANDYDASVDGTYSSAPITARYEGIFEALGHAVSNLNVNSADQMVGLFAQAKGTLRDLGLLKASIGGSSQYAGTLLGDSLEANIIACYATGAMQLGAGAVVVGGLVGKSDSVAGGTIVRSHASVSVIAPTAEEVGGLVGGSTFEISLSYATGRVEAGNSTSAGGLVGALLQGSSIETSYALGKVSAGDDNNVGGLVGLAGGAIENAYARGAVSGGTTGNVGGFAGEIGATVRASYSTGHVKGKAAGGFAGPGKDGLSADYWDTDTSGKNRREGCGDSGCGRGAKGLTMEKFQSGLPDGFDPNIWGQKKTINGGFPYLRALPPK